MDKAKVKKWLDKITKAAKQLARIKDFSNELTWCNGGVCHGIEDSPYVQLNKGIHEIGELFGLEVVQYSESDTFYYYRLIWNGVDIIQLDEKEK